MKFRRTLIGLCGLALLGAPIVNAVDTWNPTLSVSAQETTEETAPAYDFEYEEFTDGVTRFGLVTNPNDGPDITFSLDSGINILTEDVDGETYYFRDLNNNGELDVFEDWREDATTRAEALSQVISIDQAAGLMLFSSHERDQAAGLTDDQKTYLENDDLRNVLHAGPNNAEDTVTWSNQFQAFVETLGSEEEPIIPVNFSSDPRSVAGNVTAYNADGADISRWPSNLGIAATFNPEVMEEFSEMSSEEYRALGITMALGPQIELATEPRWLRVDGTFGEDARLSTDMTEAYINFSQSTYDDEGNERPHDLVFSAVMEGVKTLSARCENLIMITNDVGSDGMTYDPSTAAYVRMLGTANCQVAAMSDVVIDMACGSPLVVKGSLDWMDETKEVCA